MICDCFKALKEDEELLIHDLSNFIDGLMNRSFSTVFIPHRRMQTNTRPYNSKAKYTKSLRRKESHLQYNSFIFVWFLLSAMLPLTMSYPNREYGIRSSNYGKNYPGLSSHPGNNTDIPHWFNPCNGTVSSAERSSASSEESVVVFVNVIRVTCKQAIFQFERFRESYVKKTFKQDFHQLHRQYRNSSFLWLRQDVNLTKGLGELASPEHLDSLSLEETAIKVYGYLQRVAVGFEQMVSDHRQNDTDFKNEFLIAENNLKRILCEVRELIPDERLRNFENASRNIMGGDRYVSSKTHRDVRDWVIFREYMCLVEYIEQVMSYFDSKMSSAN